MATSEEQGRPMASGGRQRSLKALSIPNFRIFFGGSLVSVPGTWMQATGQAWLVLQLTNSPLALATVAALQFLPVMLLSLIGGAVADRFPRRRLMLITQSLAAVQALVMGLIVLFGVVQIWQIYILAAGLGLINALDAPLRQALVGEIVEVEYLPNAIALMSMAQNLGRIAGPGLGGLVIATFGVSANLLLNVLTFVGTIGALLLIRPGQLHSPQTIERQGVLSEVREGLSHAFRTPTVFVLLVAATFIGIFGQNFTIMVPLVAEYLVHASAAEFGIFNSCLGCGSLLAALTLSMSSAPSVRRVLLSGLAFGCILVAIGFSSHLLLSATLFFLVGFAAVTFSTSISTSLQMQAPPNMRGRFASMINFLIGGMLPIGALVTGFVATRVGVSAAILLNGTMCCSGIAVTYAYMLRVKRRTSLDLLRPNEASRAPVPALVAAEIDEAAA